MWGINYNSNYVTEWENTCYIANKLKSTEDDYGNIIREYDEPKKYHFDIQSLTDTSDLQSFGELAPKMKVAIISKALYLNEFEEFDLVYLEGATPNKETKNGENANYRVYAVQNQNAIIKLYFIKLVKGDEDNG